MVSSRSATRTPARNRPTGPQALYGKADPQSMLGRRNGSRQEALERARLLVTQGLDFDSIVARLRRDGGVGERSARAIAAQAFAPWGRPVTLASELRAIEESLDRRSR
jgi:hypothetical protein